MLLDGSRSLLVHHEGDMLDALRNGQGVLSVVALGGLTQELDGAITTLRPPSPKRDALVAEWVTA